MKLIPGPDVEVGEATTPRRYFHFETELGDRPDMTNHEVHLRIYKRREGDEGAIEDEEIAELVAVASDITEAEWYFDHTLAATGQPDEFLCEWVVWDDDTPPLTFAPIERYSGTYTVAPRLEAP